MYLCFLMVYENHVTCIAREFDLRHKPVQTLKWF